MSTFYGLDVARRALMVSQKAIDVTGHNIANAETSGYTRQRLVTASVEPATGATRFLMAGQGQTGGGVTIRTVDQIRSPFLDRQYRNESTRTAQWATRADQLAYVEGLFDELSGTGLSDALSDFSASLQEVSKNPINKEHRTNLLQTATNLTDIFGHFSSQLVEMQNDQDQAVVITVGQVNNAATTISDLNIQIAQYELGGQKANDLRDQRDVLLDELARMTAFEASENADGELQVRIGGEILVDHDQTRLLQAIPSIDNPMTGETDGLHAIVWADNGTLVGITGGSLKAMMDLRDGATSDNIGMPYLNEQLGRLATGIAEAINAVHSSGWTLPAEANGYISTAGIPFFTTSDGSATFTAANLAVNPAIVQDVFQIAASSVEISDPSQRGNNGNALAIIALFDSDAIPGIGSFSGFFDSMIGEIAVESSNAFTRLSGQQALLSSLDMQRQSISAVSLDEEATNLIKYQHSYAAAARLITAIDECLDVLINRTGVVGR